MVWSVVATFTLTQASHGVGANAADALFFLRFGVDRLPSMIAISGVAVMISVLGHVLGVGARGPTVWLPAVGLGSAVWAALEWVAVMAAVPGIYPVVWVSTQVVVMVTLTVMWNTAGSASG